MLTKMLRILFNFYTIQVDNLEYHIFSLHCKFFFILEKAKSVPGSVIQATRTVEFENGLRTGVLLGGCWGP